MGSEKDFEKSIDRNIFQAFDSKDKTQDTPEKKFEKKITILVPDTWTQVNHIAAMFTDQAGRVFLNEMTELKRYFFEENGRTRL